MDTENCSSKTTSTVPRPGFAGGGATYAGNTKYQAAEGFKDTAEEMFKYLSAKDLRCVRRHFAVFLR